MTLVDLFPTARRIFAEEMEAACEYIEATAGQPFSEPSLARSAGWYGARQAIRSMLALGLIERISPPRARPVFYVVPERFAAPLWTAGIAHAASSLLPQAERAA